MFFSVNATSITMIVSPAVAVSRGSMVTITCRTGSANPAANVTWTHAEAGKNEELTDHMLREHSRALTVKRSVSAGTGHVKCAGNVQWTDHEPGDTMGW